jgi:hypothetical protein
MAIPRSTSESVNLLELKPVRLIAWENTGDGHIVLIYPKFRSRFLQKHIVPLLAKPNFRIRLDDYGSFIWQRCDGRTDVAQIVAEMQASFGEQIESVYERVGLFLKRMESEQFISI